MGGNYGTALHMAARSNHMPVVKLLVARGADVNAVTDDGSTPLMKAVYNKDLATDALRYLLDHGADIEAHDNKGYTAIAHAAAHGAIECIRVLADRDGDVETTDLENKTPLMLAVEHNHIEAIQALLEKRTRAERALALAEKKKLDAIAFVLVDAVDPTLKAQVLGAVASGDEEAVNQLIADRSYLVRVERANPSYSPLCEAVRKRQIAMANHLLRLGAPIARHDKRSVLVLHVAAAGDDVECVRVLLKAGASVDDRDRFGRTALMYACHHKALAAIHALAKGRTDVDAQRTVGGGKMALGAAAADGHVEVMQALLDEGAAVDKADCNGNTSLLHAVRARHVGAIRLLLNHGASRTWSNLAGDTPISTAEKTGDLAIHGLLDILKVDEGIVSAATQGDTALVAEFISAGVDIDVKSGRLQSTALMAAASYGRLDTARYLLRHDASVATSDWYRWTPLGLAALNGCNSVVVELLAAGAEVEVKNHHGTTAMMAAASRRHTTTVGLLLGRGAQVHSRDKFGKTALCYAMHSGCAEIIELLLSHSADMNAASDSRDAPLILAARTGKAAVVENLVAVAPREQHDAKSGDSERPAQQ